MDRKEDDRHIFNNNNTRDDETNTVDSTSIRSTSVNEYSHSIRRSHVMAKYLNQRPSSQQKTQIVDNNQKNIDNSNPVSPKKETNRPKPVSVKKTPTISLAELNNIRKEDDFAPLSSPTTQQTAFSPLGSSKKKTATGEEEPKQLGKPPRQF
jgi:hypothetical protein